MKPKNGMLISKKSLSLATVFIIGLLVLSACASQTPAANPPAATVAPTATTAPTSTVAPTATAAMAESSLSVATDPKLGSIVVGNNGMTVYVFLKDGPDTINCNAACLAKWPPVTTMGNPTLGTGIDASLIGSATLSDGTKVVTYNHMPLYYWSKDQKPGDITGLGIGNVWYLVSPQGTLVGQPAATPTAAGPTPTAMAGAMTEPTISVSTDPKLGQILVGTNGMTLYMFTNDTPDKSNCSGGCAKAWPPLLTMGKPNLGTGVDASLIGTITLADGTMQVTYNHMPLYYWAKDQKAGDTTGQGVGNVWFVVGPDGKPIMK